MIVQILKEKVTVYGFCLNGQDIIVEIESRINNGANTIFKLNVFEESDYKTKKHRKGNISELDNRFQSEGELLNFIQGLYLISENLTAQGKVKDTDYFLKESLETFPENKYFRVSISYSEAATNEEIHEIVQRMITAGIEIHKKETYGYAYLEEIEPADLVKLENNINILVEEIPQ